MGFWDAVLLGIIQGLTEFLPVSSSGHLAVGQELLGYKAEGHVLFNIIVHIGTLGAVLWVYRASLARFVQGGLAALTGKEGEGGLVQRCQQNEAVREMFWIVLATIPTGVIGILFQKQLKQAFGSLTTIAILFCVTGVILVATLSRPSGKVAISSMGWHRALIIGLCQGIAILPGISRSGMTIAIALLLGLRRDEAARFSFLLAIPAISGAAVLELRKVTNIDANLVSFIAGGVAAGVVGYLALRFLIKLVQQGRLAWFAVYLWLLAGTILTKLHVFG